MTAPARWLQLAEVGSSGALRFGAGFHRRFGRGPSLVGLWPASLYYALRHAPARRASRRYLERVARAPGAGAVPGRAPGLAAVTRHFREFGVSLYDRMVIWGGGLDSFEIEHDGSEEIFRLARTGRGALLLGAHLGSLDLLGFIARRYDLRVNVAAYFENAERVNAFFEARGPAQVHLIRLDPRSANAALAIRACIERGEFVVVLADRPPIAERGRSAHVPFLGHPARFPLGPFLLASALACPVYLSLCVCVGDSRYRTILRPIAEPEVVPRGERDAWARDRLARYVGWLEDFCRQHPLQWFNFYDYWEEEAA